MDAATRKGLAIELGAMFDCRPTGGNERERQAWINGFREATDAIVEALVDETPPSDFMADIYEASRGLWGTLMQSSREPVE